MDSSILAIRVCPWPIRISRMLIQLHFLSRAKEYFEESKVMIEQIFLAILVKDSKKMLKLLS